MLNEYLFIYFLLKTMSGISYQFDSFYIKIKFTFHYLITCLFFFLLFLIVRANDKKLMLSGQTYIFVFRSTIRKSKN